MVSLQNKDRCLQQSVANVFARLFSCTKLCSHKLLQNKPIGVQPMCGAGYEHSQTVNIRSRRERVICYVFIVLSYLNPLGRHYGSVCRFRTGAWS